ncbi:hypothetical protein [Halorubrum sp. HHNYT27]|uniref:hypothetical protein n=1 Tax=Halorubrum sp. HHNYT27 TaxID=3402275 RepID=UPI003EBDAA35
MTDVEPRRDTEDSTRSGASPGDAYRAFSERVPGMAPRAPKRNVLVVLGALLVAALLIAPIAPAP